MNYLKRIREEILFSRYIRREKSVQRIGELSLREKRLYDFRNNREVPPKMDSAGS